MVRNNGTHRSTSKAIARIPGEFSLDRAAPIKARSLPSPAVGAGPTDTLSFPELMSAARDDDYCS